MPLAALRLVNPPRRRKAATKRRRTNAPAGTVRRVRTKTGTRYMKKVGSRRQFTATPNPKRKRRTTKKTVRRAAPKRKAAPKRRTRTNPTTTAKRRAAAKKAVATRKRNAAKRSAAAKKAAATRRRRRRNPLDAQLRRATRAIDAPRPKRKRTKRATSPKKRRTAVAKRRGPSKAKARASMKALWAKARRQGKKSIKGVRLGTAKRKRSAAPKRRRRSGWAVSRTRKGKLRLRHSSRPRRVYRPVARRKGKWRPRLRTAKANPAKTLKQTLPIYGGMLAVRALSGLFGHYVTPRLGTIPAGVAKVLPAGAAFLFSTLVAPKIGVFKKNAKLMEGMKLGSTVLLLDGILKNFVLPSIPATVGSPMEAVKNSLAGYDDMGVQGYGLGAYISDPTGYSLPPRHPTAEPGVGLDVHEAMALDEYIADQGMGFDVSEALAGTEIDYMQRGGAGGSLSKTVFTD